jgi:type IV pilus assembly protein PilM
MALPFLGSKARKRDLITAVDLGTNATKAVQLQRRGDKLSLTGFAIQEALPKEAATSPEALGRHLAQINQALGGRAKHVVLALGVTDSFVRPAELPMVPASDMRSMLKLNSKTYLQQDLPDHVFDCYILPPRPGTKPEAMKPNQKGKVLVGGAKRKIVEDLQAAARNAGLVAEAIVPGLIAPANAFECAQPEAFSKEAVALVDLGFRNSSITLLLCGEPMLSRVVAIGGDRLTSGVAESLGISYDEAEGIKLGLAEEVQTTILSLLSPLGRELRASIDFFEHQHDKAVSQVFVSGGSARSDYILQMLQTELMAPCVKWNPAAAFSVALPSPQMAELEPSAPQLAVAVGAALAVL